MLFRLLPVTVVVSGVELQPPARDGVQLRRSQGRHTLFPAVNGRARKVQRASKFRGGTVKGDSISLEHAPECMS